MPVEIPAFVDLCCDPGFPGFPVRETPASLAAAARAGGFSDLVLSPRVDPVRDTPEHVGLVQRSVGGVRLHPLGALTVGLEGQELAEAGLLLEAGVVGLSDGGLPVRDTVVLRNALEYAERFGAVVFLRPADADLDALGSVHESRVAATIGLRGNPGSTEEIGVARVLALLRRCPARVHLSHLSTRRAVDLLRAARAEGLPLSASTPARNLLLDEAEVLAAPYDARFRLHPPLRGREDREALLQAVREGLLLLSADHAPRAPEEKEHEFERCVPGSTGLETAFAAAMTALGDLDRVVEALALGPRRLLGLPEGPTIAVDPDAEWIADEGRQRSMGSRDALSGRRLRGVVLA